MPVMPNLAVQLSSNPVCYHCMFDVILSRFPLTHPEPAPHCTATCARAIERRNAR
jgi:hypothetical protein